jgi:hypothetical protein
VVGDELAVEQGEAARPKPRDQPGERYLGRIGLAAEHAFAEESAAEPDSIHPTDQFARPPNLDAVGAADLVEVGHGRRDGRIDPRLRTVGATFEHAGEVTIVGDSKAARAQPSRQRARQVKAVQGQDRTLARLDPEQVLAVAALGHWEDAGGIALEDEAGIERGHGWVEAQRG